MTSSSKLDHSRPQTLHPFDRDTAVVSLENGIFEASIDRGWWIVTGPNGGYLAGIILRALVAAVGDDARIPRSLTIHYLRPPAEGPCRIRTQVERTGRSLSTVTGRLEQGGKLIAIAIAAISAPRTGPHFEHAVMPEAPAPEGLESGTPDLPLGEQYEWRFLPNAGRDDVTERALVAAWMRFASPRRPDYLALAAYCDGLPPAIFTTGRDPVSLGGVPTVDLTIHFRADLSEIDLAADSFLLGVCRSHTAREGFVEEDVEIWTRDGILLAQSRQLAVAGGD